MISKKQIIVTISILMIMVAGISAMIEKATNIMESKLFVIENNETELTSYEIEEAREAWEVNTRDLYGRALIQKDGN